MPENLEIAIVAGTILVLLALLGLAFADLTSEPEPAPTRQLVTGWMVVDGDTIRAGFILDPMEGIGK